jgi:hypothetical protein
VDGNEHTPGGHQARRSDAFAAIAENVKVASDQRVDELRERQFAVIARLVERALSARP